MKSTTLTTYLCPAGHNLASPATFKRNRRGIRLCGSAERLLRPPDDAASATRTRAVLDVAPDH